MAQVIDRKLQAPAPGDPSMDDILASIRRILSEEEPPPAAAAPEAAAPEEPEDDALLLDKSMMVAAGHPLPTPPEPPAFPPAPAFVPDLAPAAVLPTSPPPEPVVEEPMPPPPPPAMAEPEPMAPPDIPPSVAFVPELEAPALEPPALEPPALETPAILDPPTPFQPAEPPMSHSADAALVAPEAAAAAQSSVSALMRKLSAERSLAVSRGGITIEEIVREELRPLLKEWLDIHLAATVERLVRAEIERVTSGAL